MLHISAYRCLIYSFLFVMVLGLVALMFNFVEILSSCFLLWNNDSLVRLIRDNIFCQLIFTLLFDTESLSIEIWK